jgi:hypothetical protein
MFQSIKHWLDKRKAVNRLLLLGRMIDAVDKSFVKSNIPRKLRQQFWRDFVSSEQFRKDFAKKI